MSADNPQISVKFIFAILGFQACKKQPSATSFLSDSLLISWLVSSSESLG